MKTPQVDILFAFFPYGGNGGISSEHPSIRRWFADTLAKCKLDPRIGKVHAMDFCDTPITMTRNAAVQAAKRLGCDFLVMTDSDQWPDVHLGQDHTARPWWDTSFEFAYQRLVQGKLTVVGAPYCGPPPVENVYVFRWANYQSDHPGVDHRLEAFTREEAAQRAGIEEVAALPTGLILFDLRCFEMVGPPYFYYEYRDAYEAEKVSTEDVTATRDIALFGQDKFGYSPIHCNWDAWAGHMKPKCVGKPQVLTIEAIGDKYRRAMEKPAHEGERMMELDFAGAGDFPRAFSAG
jgi:hypothetical protein